MTGWQKQGIQPPADVPTYRIVQMYVSMNEINMQSWFRIIGACRFTCTSVVRWIKFPVGITLTALHTWAHSMIRS